MPSMNSRGEAGYNMVFLIVAITVLNILVAAMLPLWSTQIRREKEEELIFRGFQYAEAIRVYHQRFQSYPVKLEQLIQVKPRCIRQLWKDPMTDDGKWSLIFQNQPEVPLERQPPNPKGDQPKEDEDGRPPQFGPDKGDVVAVGPIIGVRSRSGEKSMLVMFGHERYDEWAFTETVLLGGAQPPPKDKPFPTDPGVGPTAGLQLSTRWLGRPMRYSGQLPGGPQEGTMPDGSPPGQNSVKPPARRPSNRP